MTRKRRLYIRLLLATPLVIWLIVGFYKMFSNFKDINFIADCKTEYINLFSSIAKKDLICRGTSTSKVRNDVSYFEYDKNYNVVVYKIDLLNNKALDKIIDCRQGSVSQTTNEPYIIGGGDKFGLRFISGKPYPVSSIIMTVDGDSPAAIIKNDTLAYYYLNYLGFSIQYSGDAPRDIVAESKHNPYSVLTDKLPTNLLFLKRAKAVYLFILAPKINAPAFDKLLLYKLVIKRTV